MCWMVLILARITPTYHRDMYEAKDKESSANNQVSVTQMRGVECRVRYKTGKRQWWKEHTYTPKSKKKDSKILTVVLYRL